MKYGPLQISQVTVSAGKVVASGHTYYWGFTALSDDGASNKTLCVSDSASNTTGTAIKTYLIIQAGTSKETSYINSIWPEPLNIINGLRTSLIGGNAGTTVFIHYGG